MRTQNRIAIANNAQYHQDLADHYAGMIPEAVKADSAATDTPPAVEQRTGSEQDEYLATLHAEVAQQLRDVLAGGEPPAIVGAEPPITRAVPTQRIEPTRRRANAVG